MFVAYQGVRLLQLYDYATLHPGSPRGHVDPTFSQRKGCVYYDDKQIVHYILVESLSLCQTLKTIAMSLYNVTKNQHAPFIQLQVFV